MPTTAGMYAARNDRRVRCLATDIGDEAPKYASLELDHVGRRDISGNQQQRVLAAKVSWRDWRSGVALRMGQRSKHPLNHLLQVRLALAQVVVFHLVELPSQHFKLSGQRPLRVVVPIEDPLTRPAGEGLIVQQHQVHIQQRGELVRRVLRQFRFQCFEFAHHRIARAQ